MTTPSNLSIQLRGRAKAGGIHVLIGLVILIPLVYLILVQWYPGVYFATDGGWRGLFIVLCVDLVLGPTLTLIIFNPVKPLKKIYFDLAVIAVLQISALTWGVYAVYSQRPVAVVFWEGSFTPVIAEVFHRQKISIDQVRELSPLNPALIYALLPQSTEDASQMFLISLNEGLEPFQQFGRLRSLPDGLEPITSRELDMQALLSEHPTIGPAIDRLLDKHDTNRGQTHYFHFRGRYHYAVLVVTNRGELLGGIALDSD